MKQKSFVVDVLATTEFDFLMAKSGHIRKIRAEGEKLLPSFAFLLQDIFYALFRQVPGLYTADQITHSARLNLMVIDELLKHQDFKRARKFAVNNILSSGMFTVHFAELILEAISAEISQVCNEIFCTEEELEYAVIHKEAVLRVVTVAYEDGRDAAAEAYSLVVEQWDLSIADKLRQLRKLAGRLRTLWNTGPRKKLAILEAGVQGQEADRFEAEMRGRGDKKGIWAMTDIGHHLRQMEKYHNSSKLKRLAQRIGMLREIKDFRPQKVKGGGVAEFTGIIYGEDLSMVVAEEWVEYLDITRRPGFKKKLADGELCMYDIRGNASRGRGSLIICLDNSGSMQGSKEEISKAIAIVLMEIAFKQKRNFVIIMFGGPEDDLKVFEFTKGRSTFEHLTEVGEYFLCSSGTDFEKPLLEALRYQEKDKLPDSDIVFITDGVCQVSKEFLEVYHKQKKLRRFRTFAIMVNYGQVSTASLESFADELYCSTDLKGIDVAGKLFGKIRGE